MKRNIHRLQTTEFVCLLALMTSIIALSIDAMLPALSIIGLDLGVENPNDSQLVIGAMFFGLAVGQLIAGPLSDSFGRKPIIYIGYIIFVLGCFLSIISETYLTMLIGRLLQGLGAAGPRIIGMALVRDLYEGRAMARIMSLIMVLFIFVPTIAPSLGQIILLLFNWRAIFALLLITSLTAFCWFAIRHPEPLPKEERHPFSIFSLTHNFIALFQFRQFIGYTLAAGIMFGAFLGYLNSAQQIFQTVYDTKELFSLYFGLATLPIGLAALFNSKYVVKVGMRYLCIRALIALTLSSLLMLSVIFAIGSNPPLIIFMLWVLPTFFCMGILFGNFNALAMEPVGHMAGMGAAGLGSLSTFVSLPLGLVIGASFDGTILPIIIGFSVLGAASIIVMQITEANAFNSSKE